MIILIIATIMVHAGIIIAWMMDDGIIGIPVATIGGIILIISLITIPITHYQVHGEIHSFEATKSTVDRARATGRKIEDAAMQLKIIEQNQRLASTQYYNGTIWDIWIPDAIDELNPIE